MKKEKGILLIALGHPIYGKMAAALAASIKAASQEIPIVLYCSEQSTSRLMEGEKKLFDQMHTMPEEYYITNGIERFLKAKTFVYDLSPFDETIFLDVDMIWNPKKKPEDLFEELNNLDFTMCNEGYVDFALGINKLKHNYTFWFDLAEFRRKYSRNKRIMSNKLYQLRSEFIYFKKNKAMEKYFEMVKNVYDNPQIEVTYVGNGLADEYAYNVASCINGIYPHTDYYSPMYWHYKYTSKKPSRAEIMKDFYLISMGGNKSDKFSEDFYNDIAAAAYQQLGLYNAHKHVNKQKFLTERNKF